MDVTLLKINDRVYHVYMEMKGTVERISDSSIYIRWRLDWPLSVYKRNMKFTFLFFYEEAMDKLEEIL